MSRIKENPSRPKIVKRGNRRVVCLTAPIEQLPKIDIAKLVQQERDRWPSWVSKAMLKKSLQMQQEKSEHPAVEVAGLAYRYGSRVALEDVSFSVPAGEIFGLLGPNGSGKTTLFRILSTLIPPQSGSARILGHDLAQDLSAVRRAIGVVFQAPSLDKKLTAEENLRHQGHLYGLMGSTLSARIEELLTRVGMLDRRHELTEKMSGGQRRRVELAKGLLHRPKVLLLDEPSTGLDPGARRDLMRYLKDLAREGVTCLLTTHLMEEAGDCGRLGVMSLGKLIALDTPDALKARIGGQVVSIQAKESQTLSVKIAERFAVVPQVLDGSVRIERDDGHRFVAQIAEAFPGEFESVSVSKPTLEDVFVRLTGHGIGQDEMPVGAGEK